MGLMHEIAADLDEIFSETGRTVAYRDNFLPALVSEITLEEELDTGGFVRGSALMAKIRRSSFDGPLPKVGETLTVDDQRLRIEKITHRAGHPLVMLELGSPER